MVGYISVVPQWPMAKNPSMLLLSPYFWLYIPINHVECSLAGRCAHVHRMISHKRFLPGSLCICVCSFQTGDCVFQVVLCRCSKRLWFVCVCCDFSFCVFALLPMPHICSCPYNLVSGKDVPRPARGKVGQAPVRGSQEVPRPGLMPISCLPRLEASGCLWWLHPKQHMWLPEP